MNWLGRRPYGVQLLMQRAYVLALVCAPVGLAGCQDAVHRVDGTGVTVDVRACLGALEPGDSGVPSGCRDALDEHVAGDVENGCLLLRRVAADQVGYLPLAYRNREVHLAAGSQLPLVVGEVVEAELVFLRRRPRGGACNADALPFGRPCAVDDELCLVKLVQGPTRVIEDGLVLDFTSEERCTAEGPLADEDGLASEVCDGVDNDCDGQVDESDPTLGDVCVGDGLGACARGTRRCCRAADADDQGCQPGVPWCRPQSAPGVDAETCNGHDDDCDGSVDEGYSWRADSQDPESAVGVGDACEAGVGGCARPAVVVCEDQETATCGGEPGSPVDEVCNDIDDDCDGAVDETFAVGGECEAGVGACRVLGVFVCVDDGVACSAEEGSASDERCNDFDDDCDGLVDEDFGGADLGGACTSGLGVCAVEGVLACVQEEGGGAACDAPAGEPGPELCSTELDEDCDGTVDEGFDDLGEPCEDGAGACRQVGFFRCEPVDRQRLICSASALERDPLADESACDGIDADCDGLVDEDFVPALDDCGAGACSEVGELVCEEGGVIGTTCREGMARPDDVSCNGVDDDCDGRADEDLGVEPSRCGIGDCGNAGLVLCINGRLQDTCMPQNARGDDRTCNGRDEDCDQGLDEGYVPRNTTCGVGACAAAGLTECLDGREVDRCAPANGGGADDDCNDVDDDCDGRTDESYRGRPTQCGTGSCTASGELRCTPDGIVDGCQPRAAALNDPSCDGIDQDCDGAVDEDFPVTQSTCGRGACRAVGMLTCDGGVAQDSCVPDKPAAADTTCDGLDDDCDGTHRRGQRPR